uniref:Uncharacterized protein n=1 Tax=Glossina austeni TaxID=7395 RepID=A0A1A9UET6_GLOAU
MSSLGRDVGSAVVELSNDVIIEELGQSKDMKEESNNETLSKSKNNVNYRDDEQPKTDGPMAPDIQYIRRESKIVPNTLPRAFEIYAFKSTDLNLKVLYNEYKTDGELQNSSNLIFLKNPVLNF